MYRARLGGWNLMSGWGLENQVPFTNAAWAPSVIGKQAPLPSQAFFVRLPLISTARLWATTSPCPCAKTPAITVVNRREPCAVFTNKNGQKQPENHVKYAKNRENRTFLRENRSGKGEGVFLLNRVFQARFSKDYKTRQGDNKSPSVRKMVEHSFFKNSYSRPPGGPLATQRGTSYSRSLSYSLFLSLTR